MLSLYPGLLFKSWERGKYRILVSVTDISHTYFLTSYDSSTRLFIYEVFNKNSAYHSSFKIIA